MTVDRVATTLRQDRGAAGDLLPVNHRSVAPTPGSPWGPPSTAPPGLDWGGCFFGPGQLEGWPPSRPGRSVILDPPPGFSEQLGGRLHSDPAGGAVPL